VGAVDEAAVRRRGRVQCGIGGHPPRRPTTHHGIQPGVLLAIAVVPALVDFLASYAIRHGSVARPNGYPVRFRGRTGRWVNGANLALAGAVLFSVLAGVEVWEIYD
jgi:hypothetical protein